MVTLTTRVDASNRAAMGDAVENDAPGQAGPRAAVENGEDVELQNLRAAMLEHIAERQQVTELPESGIRVRIRGTRSFMGGNGSLHVIDGMAIQTVDGSLYGISPGDVESISMLKVSSATSIYGSRGADGVVLIKTRRGTR